MYISKFSGFQFSNLPSSFFSYTWMSVCIFLIELTVLSNLSSNPSSFCNCRRSGLWTDLTHQVCGNLVAALEGLRNEGQYFLMSPPQLVLLVFLVVLQEGTILPHLYFFFNHFTQSISPVRLDSVLLLIPWGRIVVLLSGATSGSSAHEWVVRNGRPPWRRIGRNLRVSWKH